MNTEHDDEKEHLTPSILYVRYTEQFYAAPNTQQFLKFCKNHGVPLKYKDCLQLLRNPPTADTVHVQTVPKLSTTMSTPINNQLSKFGVRKERSLTTIDAEYKTSPSTAEAALRENDQNQQVSTKSARPSSMSSGTSSGAAFPPNTQYKYYRCSTLCV